MGEVGFVVDIQTLRLSDSRTVGTIRTVLPSEPSESPNHLSIDALAKAGLPPEALAKAGFLAVASAEGLTFPASDGPNANAPRRTDAFLRSSISSLRTSISSLRSSYSDLRSSVSGLPTPVFGLRSSVSQLRTPVYRLRSSDSRLQPSQFLVPRSNLPRRPLITLLSLWSTYFRPPPHVLPPATAVCTTPYCTPFLSPTAAEPQLHGLGGERPKWSKMMRSLTWHRCPA